MSRDDDFDGIDVDTVGSDGSVGSKDGMDAGDGRVPFLASSVSVARLSWEMQGKTRLNYN